MDAQIDRVTTRKTQRITLPVHNLGCAMSGPLIAERALVQTTGVTYVFINPATEMAYIEYDPKLVYPDQLSAALERVGFGLPHVASEVKLAKPGEQAKTFDPGRLALAAGVWFAVLYTLCLFAVVFFPTVLHMRVFWEVILVGFDWTQPATLLLGLVEAFLYGFLGVWSFAAIYNTLASHRMQ